MKRLFLTIASILSLSLATSLLSAPAYAACAGTNTPQGQAEQGLGETGSGCDSSGVGNIVETIVKILSYVVGIAAIIVVILSGFRYITSAGDAAKVSSAKNTLIYALVGVAIAALAQAIVYFVFTKAKNAA